MLCFSVDSPDSLENVESKWVGEITENCPGVKLVLVALKCDLREQEEDDREEGREPKKPTIDYKQGLAVAERVKALRYLGKFGLLREAACRIAGDVTKEPATNTLDRMLRNEEPRRQRGFHRSSARRPHSQERQRRQGQHLLLRHVSFATNITPKPPPCNSSNSRRPFFSVSTLHEHIPPTFLVIYWEIQFFLNFSGANELQGHRLWTLLRFGCWRLERCIFAFVSFFASTFDSYGWIYFLLRKRWAMAGAWSDIGGLGTIRVLWLTWLTGWLGGLFVSFGESSRARFCECLI
jgi:hypothetical protein